MLIYPLSYFVIIHRMSLVTDVTINLKELYQTVSLLRSPRCSGKKLVLLKYQQYEPLNRLEKEYVCQDLLQPINSYRFVVFTTPTFVVACEPTNDVSVTSYQHRHAGNNFNYVQVDMSVFYCPRCRQLAIFLSLEIFVVVFCFTIVNRRIFCCGNARVQHHHRPIQRITDCDFS